MTSDEIVARLDQVGALQDRIEFLRNENAASIRALMQAAGILEKVDAIEQLTAESIGHLDDELAATRGIVSNAVLELGATVKAASLMAVYQKPRVSWDTRMLEGYALKQPEILAARKIGEPSVSIRKI